MPPALYAPVSVQNRSHLYLLTRTAVRALAGCTALLVAACGIIGAVYVLAFLMLALSH